MNDNPRKHTQFGDFPISVEKNLDLMQDKILGKSLVIFDPSLNPYDFKILIEQLKNMGITLYWNQSLFTRGLQGYRHLVIVEPEDVNLIRLVAFNIKTTVADELLNSLHE